jgi:DNA primase
VNDNVIEAIKQRVDIVDLIGDQVPLQKSGKTFKANCPFHGERTPSFYVYPDRQYWHCYGACATGGDIFAYVQKRDGVEFREALRTLAERAGVQLRSGSAANEAYDRIGAANEAAIAFFRQALAGSTAGAEARDYVARRGLDEATVATFELGFAPDGWENLCGFLRGKGFTDAELLQAGLASERETGGVYDRFRRRLIFPIRDDRGRAVGFGGRALDDAKPKYLNTPQTPLFDKGSLLYLLDRATQPIREAGEAVLVEGYLDAITAHQFGYRNVVATLGTALTERHIALLKGRTKRVTLAMDADSAGIEAALRGEEVARRAGAEDGGRGEVVVAWDGLVRAQARAPVEVRVFSVPNGKDPDEAIRQDPSGWPEWVKGALPPFEFRLRLESRRIDMNDTRQRMELAERMLPLLLQIGDQAIAGAYVDRLATLLRVRAEPLQAHLRRVAQKPDLGTKLPQRVRADAAQPASGQAPRRAREDPSEAVILALLLRFPDLREAGEALDTELFLSAAHRALFVCWLEQPALSEEGLDEALRPLLADLMAMRLVEFTGPEAAQALIDTVQRLRQRRQVEQRRLLAAEMTELRGQLDEAAAAESVVRLVRDGAAAEAPEPVLALASHLLQDAYLMRETHALEWEKRTHRLPRWALEGGEDGAEDRT